MKNKLLWSTSLVCGVLAGVVPMGADAQTAASPPTVASPSQVEEVVVTANRRSESLSRVGVAVTAVSASVLARNDIKTADDLVKLVPGFDVTQSYGGAEVYTLRGVGFNSPNASATSPIGVYVDQAALPYPYMAEGVLFDLDRVEVLKGPQGTLYGRNTTGGLVDYITAKPTADFHYGGTVEFGNYATVDAGGYVSGPVNDSVRLRLAVDSQNRFDGYQESISTGEKLGVLHQHALRFTADFNNGGPFEASLSGTYWNKRADTSGTQSVAVIVNSPFRNPGIVAFNPTSNTQVDFLSNNNQPQANIGIYHPAPLTNSDFGSVTLNASYKLSENLKVVSLTTYDNLNHRDASDAEGANVESVYIASSGKIRSISEELRLVGDYGPLTWSVGGYYANDHVSDDDIGYITQDSTILGLRFLADELPHPNFTDAQIASSFGNFQNVDTQTPSVAAGFANVDYKLNDLIKVSLGGRYTDDSNTFKGCTIDTQGGNIPVVDTVYPLFTGSPVNLQPGACYTLKADGSGLLDGPAVEKQDQTNFSWRANIDITPNSDTLIYGTISRGFKAGAFPILAASNVDQLTPVQQEELTSYEIGTKLGLFDRRVQLNATAFYYDYNNKQVYGRVVDIIFGTLTRIRNIPSSHEFGLEGDVTWRINTALTATAAATYLDSTIGNFTDYNDLGVLVNDKGNPFPFTPKYQANAGLVYDAPLTDDFRLNASVDASYQDVSHSDLNDLSFLKIDSRILVDATLGLAPTQGRWTAGLYVKNLFDTYYYTGGATAIETAYRYPGVPREFGVRFSYKY